VAPQALALLNDQFVRTVSLDFAERLIKETDGDLGLVVERGFLLALGRTATETEKNAATAFVVAQTKERQEREKDKSADEIRRRAVADLCQALFSLNEFLYID
jgi:hypothetical protein